MAIAVVLILLVVGTLIFHFVSPWYLTPLASNWSMIDTTIDITLIVPALRLPPATRVSAHSYLPFRQKPGLKAPYHPENANRETWLTVLTSSGVAAMLAPGLLVGGQIITVPDDAMEVEVVGQQWHWSFRFPGDDGVLGNVDIRHISEANPFGMDPEDPNGQDDILIANPVLHLPIDQAIKTLLRSKDVLHNFTVPQFRVKMDLVPGTVTYLWFTPTVVGTYEILCEELCGLAHYAMRGKVVVESQADFDAWLNAQPPFAELSAQPPGDPVAGQATYTLCAACHGPAGQGMQPLNAPKLTGQQGW